MANHRKSRRFYGDDFDCEILEVSNDRDYIELREEHFINEYDTFNNGLNNSFNGKGLQDGFTTKGFIYSEESRKLMSEKAKARAQREGFDVRSKRSKDNFKDPEYVAKQKAAKKGKRLRPPKLTDEQVIEIRLLWEQEKDIIEQHLVQVNEERKKKNAGWRPLNAPCEFSKKYSEVYNVSLPTIKGIILWKTRTKVLPSLYGKN